MNKEEIIEVITGRRYRDPYVFLFDKSLENTFNDTTDELKRKGKKILDINQYATIKPEDYDMSVDDLGFNDETGQLKAKDLLIDDVKKRRLIVKAKMNKLKDVVDNDTVLVVTYNDLLLKNEMFYDGFNNALYETLRSWFKDGYIFDNKDSDTRLYALVLLETNEKINDFCRYGIYAE